jgi:hypothetical protein
MCHRTICHQYELIHSISEKKNQIEDKTLSNNEKKKTTSNEG